VTTPRVTIEYPAWVDDVVDWTRPYRTDEERMRLAIRVARENIDRGEGGPFGALVVERASGRVVSVGMNSVLRLQSSTLHAEIIAFMMAQRALGSFTLARENGVEHELVSSCEPCAMCLGAVLWSGVRRVVSGATREDALRLRFEEGPVFPESYRYLEERGIDLVHGMLREEARDVLESYVARGGVVYNG
jgi:tRNA(Arg) A34 adenosine deaminase TadA